MTDIEKMYGDISKNAHEYNEKYNLRSCGENNKNGVLAILRNLFSLKHWFIYLFTIMKKLFSLLLLLITSIFLVSCWSSTSQDIINPDAQYLYFYGATCPHCQELNKKIKTAGILDQLSLEKREVYYNTENNALFLKTAKELGLKEWDFGVPFVLEKATSKYVIGVGPAFEMLSGSIEPEAITQ